MKSTSKGSFEISILLASQLYSNGGKSKDSILTTQKSIQLAIFIKTSTYYFLSNFTNKARTSAAACLRLSSLKSSNVIARLRLTTSVKHYRSASPKVGFRIMSAWQTLD